MNNKQLFSQRALWRQLQTSYPQGTVKVRAGSKQLLPCIGDAFVILRKLVAVFLLIFTFGIGNVWGTPTTITETFENHYDDNTSTTYNATRTLDAEHQVTGVEMEVEHGTAWYHASNALNGVVSVQMRAYYAKNAAASTWSGALPYLKTTDAIQGLSSISFKSKVQNTNLRIDIQYSTNGTTWSAMKTTSNQDATSQAYTTSTTTYTYNIPSSSSSTSYYIKISVSTSSTHNVGNASNYAFYVDDLAFTYDTGGGGDTYTVVQLNI